MGRVGRLYSQKKSQTLRNSSRNLNYYPNHYPFLNYDDDDPFLTYDDDDPFLTYDDGDPFLNYDDGDPFPNYDDDDFLNYNGLYRVVF